MNEVAARSGSRGSTSSLVAIGVQAFLVAQLGLRLGSRLGEEVGEAAERIAGLALIALGVLVLVERVA